MNKIGLWIIGFTLAVVCGSIGYVPSAHAYPDFDVALNPITSTCKIQAVDGNFSSTLFRYSTHGYCYIWEDANYGTRGSTFDNMKQRGEAQWTAVGTYNPTTKETTESISVRQENYDRRGYFATGTIYTTMVCAKDPWVQPDGLSCGSASPQTTGYIDPKYKLIYPGNPTVPATSLLV